MGLEMATRFPVARCLRSTAVLADCLPRTGPARSGIRNQGVVPKDVDANESRHSTQRAVTSSSAEAELCGIVRGSTEALEIHGAGRDLGLSMTLSMHTDSTVAVGNL